MVPSDILLSKMSRTCFAISSFIFLYFVVLSFGCFIVLFSGLYQSSF